MKIVITGCAGFIGLNFTKFWLDNYPSDKVIGIDALTYAANTDEIYNLSASKHNFTFYHLNICDYKNISKLFKTENPDIVINFAAETHVDRSIEDSRIFVETNVLGTQTLLDACLNSGGIRFHQISTDEVYGDLPLDTDEVFTENSPLKPSSPYSASKASADLLVLAYNKTHSLPVTISRCSNNYGKYQNDEKMIPHSTKKLLNGEKIPVYGDGKNVRDWIHVIDHCRAIEKIIFKGRLGEIYNIGGSFEISNLKLTELIINKVIYSCFDDNSGTSLRTHNKNYDEYIEFVQDRKGHDRRYALDTSKIKNEIEWEPVVSFDEGLEDTVNWIIQQNDRHKI